MNRKGAKSRLGKTAMDGGVPNISLLTKELITQSRVIAKGKRIRDVQRLGDQYGGQQSKWLKKSSPVFESEGHLCEFHWYEH